MKFHEQQHKKYLEEKDDASWQKRREYEMMLMRRFNLKKEISLLQRSFAANETSIKDYENDDIQKSLLVRLEKEYGRTGQGRVGIQTPPLLTSI